MEYKVRKSDRIMRGEIVLPASKSISNRLLIIRDLSGKPLEIENLSNSDDTILLSEALASEKREKNVGHAGTAMRFLTALLAIKPGNWILTGSVRMKERPIGNLVEALRSLGAEISYLEKEGYPPLLIKGKNLRGGRCIIDSSVSSQFISALLMIAPVLQDGLEVELDRKIISSSYIRMTLELLRYYGIQYQWIENRISIKNQKYKSLSIMVEADWSAASYWYEMVSFSEEADLFIGGLRRNSIQADSVLAELFDGLGVKTIYLPDGLRLVKETRTPKRIEFDFNDNPDLVQTLAVSCGMLGIPYYFTGTESLRIKETDRIQALKTELAKFGISIQAASDGSWISWDGKSCLPADKIFRIRTYQDHRIAMSFAPIAVTGMNIVIEEPDVVNKSYPGFWNDLVKVGFQIE